MYGRCRDAWSSSPFEMNHQPRLDLDALGSVVKHMIDGAVSMEISVGIQSEPQDRVKILPQGRGTTLLSASNIRRAKPVSRSKLLVAIVVLSWYHLRQIKLL